MAEAALFLAGSVLIILFGWFAYKIRQLDLDAAHTNREVKYRANRYLIYRADPDSRSYFGTNLIWAYRASHWLAIIGFFLILFSCSGV